MYLPLEDREILLRERAFPGMRGLIDAAVRHFTSPYLGEMSDNFGGKKAIDASYFFEKGNHGP